MNMYVDEKRYVFAVYACANKKNTNVHKNTYVNKNVDVHKDMDVVDVCGYANNFNTCVDIYRYVCDMHEYVCRTYCYRYRR